MKNSSQLLQFTEACTALATRQVPPYSSKFSKHTFTQPQPSALLGETPVDQAAGVCARRQCCQCPHGPSSLPPTGLGRDGDLGAQAQVWSSGEQPGVVAVVSGVGGPVPGLQRGAGGEAGGGLT